eukprot:4273067-Pyramimonas_sp.AAC.1
MAGKAEGGSRGPLAPTQDGRGSGCGLASGGGHPRQQEICAGQPHAGGKRGQWQGGGGAGLHG